MPLYEFRCDACSHTFEDLVPASHVPGCPVCGNASPTRLLSTFAAPSDSAGASAGCGPDDCCGGGGCESPKAAKSHGGCAGGCCCGG